MPDPNPNPIPGSNPEQAMAALIKANADSLDGVVATAIAHESLKARSALTITLLRQLYGFPERFGVAPLRELPESLNVVTELSKLSGRASPHRRPQPRTPNPNPCPQPLALHPDRFPRSSPHTPLRSSRCPRCPSPPYGGS